MSEMDSFILEDQPTPFYYPTPGGLTSNSQVFIEGVVRSIPIQINFHTADGDLPVHLVLRGNGKYQQLMLNTFQKRWGGEQVLRTDLAPGDKFSLNISVKKRYYKAVLRGTKLCSMYYISKHKIAQFSITGGLQLDKMIFIHFPKVERPLAQEPSGMYPTISETDNGGHPIIPMPSVPYAPGISMMDAAMMTSGVSVALQSL